MAEKVPYIPLFTRVRCDAYLKRVKDGVHIVQYNSDGTLNTDKITRGHSGKAIAYKMDDHYNDVEIADLSGYCGECVDKTYRQRVEDKFIGFVVGYTRINVKGIIGTQWADDPLFAKYGYCYKQITERPKVAVVYFKNNCKRYVLTEDMEADNG